MNTSTLRLLSLVTPFVFACGSPPDVVVKVGSRSLTGADVKAAETKDALVRDERLAALARADSVFHDKEANARVEQATRRALAAELTQAAIRDAVSETTLRSAYEAGRDSLKRRRIHVAQILIGDGVDPTMIQLRLQKGEDFAVVARELSVDAPSAARGGELQTLTEGSVDALFFEAGWKLKQGETSDVVVTSWGRHILRALEDPVTEVPSFEEAKPALTAQLTDKAVRELEARAEKTVSVEWVGEKK